MPIQWNNIFIALSIFLLAIPYVAYIRTPRQNKLAIYFVFLITFVVAAAVIFMLLLWSISEFGVNILLSNIGPAAVFITIVVLPSFALATWFAKRSP